MTLVFGALAQAMPSATTLEAAYACPADKRATVQVVACNRGVNTTVRLAHAPAAAADSDEPYLLYDYPLAAGETLVTAKLTLTETDVLRVYAVTGDVAFNVNGIEEDA